MKYIKIHIKFSFADFHFKLVGNWPPATEPHHPNPAGSQNNSQLSRICKNVLVYAGACWNMPT